MNLPLFLSENFNIDSEVIAVCLFCLTFMVIIFLVSIWVESYKINTTEINLYRSLTTIIVLAILLYWIISGYEISSKQSCVVVSPKGEYEFCYCDSIHPVYNKKTYPITSRMKSYMYNEKYSEVQYEIYPDKTYAYFDEIGLPLLWYYKDQNKIHFYNQPGRNNPQAIWTKPVNKKILQEHFNNIDKNLCYNGYRYLIIFLNKNNSDDIIQYRYISNTGLISKTFGNTHPDFDDNNIFKIKLDRTGNYIIGIKNVSKNRNYYDLEVFYKNGILYKNNKPMELKNGMFYLSYSIID